MVELAKKVAWFVGEFLIPRFVTDEVALRYVGDPIATDLSEWGDYEIACCMDDVEPWERFDGIAEADSFAWLGFGITFRVGNFRAWPAEVCRG